MRKNLLHLVTIVTMVVFGSCSNEDLMPDLTPEKGRAISITASMPGEDPVTRIGLEQQEDKSIVLTWEDSDQLDIVFVQGETKIKSNVKVNNISEDRKRAQFDIVIPDGIKGGEFDFYGVYGGGGLDDKNPTHVKLPSSLENATSLNGDATSSIQNRKDVMLYFEHKKVNTYNPPKSVNFKHLGSLFSITLKNVGNKNIDNFVDVSLNGVNNNDNKKWAYNAGYMGGSTYNLENGFQDINYRSVNSITFKVDKNSLLRDETVTFWGWYPVLPDRIWPELQLKLLLKRGSLLERSIFIESVNTQASRTSPLLPGKSYYFYARLNDSQIEFSNKTFSLSNEYLVEKMGTLGTMLNKTQKDTITSMVLKGEINKADFELMKKNMPKLKHLNLKDVKCENDEIPIAAFGGEPDSYGTNQKFESIILPSSIVSIGDRAFMYCLNISGQLVLPDGLISIGENAFYGCESLSGPLKLPNSLMSVGKSAFLNCKNFTGDLYIPGGIKFIEESAFNNSGFNGELSFNSELKSIGKSAFSSCGFTSIKFPTNLETIERGAFWNCAKLSHRVIFPESLLSLASGAFQHCYNVPVYRFERTTPIENIVLMLALESTVEVPRSALHNYAAKKWDQAPNYFILKVY